MTPFLIVGTPRSRTAWLAEFLSTPGRPCLHEPSLRFTQPSDLNRFLSDDSAAASDSMMTFLARRAREIRPDCKIVVVRRPLDEVEGSFHRLGLVVPRWYLEMMDRQAADVTDAAHVTFSDLGDEGVCAWIFQYCTGLLFDRDRWRRMSERNIQSNLRETVELLETRRVEHERVFGPYYDANGN